MTNFQTASNPQIIKSYAMKEYDETGRLVCQCSKFSFFLMILLGIPIFYQVEYILSIWLTSVPEYTTIFVRLILICGIIDSLSKALITYIKATGNVKWYQIIQGGFYILALPVIYLFLKLGYSPVSSLYVLLAFTIVGTFLRLFLLHTVVDNFSVKHYYSSVLVPSILVGGFAFVCCAFVSRLHPTDCLIWLAVNSFLMIGISAVIIWFIGMKGKERFYIKSLVLGIVRNR